MTQKCPRCEKETPVLEVLPPELNRFLKFQTLCRQCDAELRTQHFDDIDYITEHGYWKWNGATDYGRRTIRN